MIAVAFLIAFISIAVRLPDLYAEAPAQIDLEKSVNQIFTQIVRQNQTKKLDFVLLIDASRSMYDNIEKLLPAIGELGYICAQSNSDCRFGLVKFWELEGTPRVEIYSTLTSADLIQKNLASSLVKEFRRRNGFGLDAIFKAIGEIPFRPGSLRYLLLISDQPLRSSRAGSEEKLVSEIISNCSKNQIQVSIIGISDNLSLRLTGRTKGSWQPVAPYTETGGKPTISEIFGKQLLKTDGIIKEMAKHIAETCKPMVDVIFMLDSSESMANKVDELIDALPIFAETFDKSKLNYQFGAIRFFAASGGGESRVIVSQPLLSLEDIKKLLQFPKSGDEHLLDAILEGVPKLKTRPEAKVSLVIFTDEPSTTAQRSDATDWTSEAVAACKARNIQVNIIGASSFGSIGSKQGFAKDFQMKAPQATGGVRFVTPGSDVPPSENR